jgi:hypothetical protein
MHNKAKRIADRNRAYAFIRAQLIHKVRGVPRDPTDEGLADTLGEAPGLKYDLVRLKDGVADPSVELVTAFKRLVKTTEESIVNQYLVNPFREQGASRSH